MYMYKVWIHEKENKVYLYVNKCEDLKTLYLCKVSFRINLKCIIHSLNSLNKYLLCEIRIIIQIKQKLDWNIFSYRSKSIIRKVKYLFIRYMYLRKKIQFINIS